MNPYNFDWGAITPEGWNREKQDALHVFNVALKEGEIRDRAARFIAARVLHFQRHLPPGSTQRVVIDARGQGIPEGSLASFKSRILDFLQAEGHKSQPLISIKTN